MTTTSCERDVVRKAIGRVLFNASNYPERVQSRILGQDMGPLTDRLTDAVLFALVVGSAADA